MKTELKTLKKCPDDDALHELRLNAKKIKAIVSLFKSTGSKHKLSTKSIKALFQQAGDIRTAKLNLKKIRDNHINNRPLQLFLTDIINYEYKDLCSKYKCYIKTINSLRKKFDDAVASVTDRDVKKYYKKNISQLSISFLWPIDIQSLHDNRKIIKNLLYINKVLPAATRKSIRLDVKYLDQLQEKIGLWHDFDLTRDLLNKHGLVHIAGYASLFCQQMSVLECVKKDVDFFGNKVALKK
ncbi:MAG TPA: CHAD domain-containing protein [Flavisolibacter sp.]|nr:CHAD domain-containing protein [Flavisolibacter sp.]